uniref:Uncharacterized protein n=1 Tax=Mus spicilegus TaxID=10103 RepID=A0A8C6GVH5_MUSSI
MFQASRLADGVVNSRMLYQKKGVNSLSQPSCAVNNGPHGNKEQNRSALQNRHIAACSRLRLSSRKHHHLSPLILYCHVLRSQDAPLRDGLITS